MSMYWREKSSHLLDKVMTSEREKAFKILLVVIKQLSKDKKKD